MIRRALLVLFALPIACGSSDASVLPDTEAPVSSQNPSGDKPSSSQDPGAPSAAPLARCTPDPSRIRLFPDCPGGGGIFGDWILDGYGMPAYAYSLDERTDPRAVWPNSEDIFPIRRVRTDHFHVSGNRRVNFVAVDDGYVMLFGAERGPTYMNRFAEDQNNLAGGFSYVNDGGENWATAYRYAPASASARRVFGIGYYETETTYRDVRVMHRIVAPFGDDPLVVDEVEIQNVGQAAKNVSHYEYWDVNRHQLQTEWARTGLAAGPGDQNRDALNGHFTQHVTYDGSKKLLLAEMSPNLDESPPFPDDVGAMDWYPPPVFLASLSGAVDDVHADQRLFFGDGPPAHPAAVVSATRGGPLDDTDASGQPACLVMRSTLALAPGETKHLRFAYGYLPKGKDASVVAPYAASKDVLGASLDAWKDHLAYVVVPGEDYIHRETAWRSHLLQATGAYSDFYGEHYTPQGSAYLYLHGADGAPRDQALFAAAESYLDPALAKGNLRLLMHLADAQTGEMPYSFTGNGMREGATLHNHPSDLDIFFLFALAEYLGATGDDAFLAETVPFYGSGHPSFVDGETVLDHARAAFHHLKNDVGLGPNGLVRIHDGDWSDGIVYDDKSPSALAFTIQNGESVPNSQMALYTLPLLSARLSSNDAVLAADMKAFADALREPVKKTFGTHWFARAWLRNTINQGYLRGNDQDYDGFHANYIDLEAQPWGLLSGVLDDAQTKAVLDSVEARLDDDSPIGPRLSPGGETWPAISQLMTWAYARYRPASAWRSLHEHMYATHATALPTQWMGVLSGPDGFDLSSGSWVSPITPMTDFPVGNMNPEAMWIFGLARTSGIEAVSDGLLVTPRGGGHDTYVLDLPVIRLEVAPGHVSGEYRAQNDGALVLTVQTASGPVKKPLAFKNGQRVPFDVRW